MLIHRDTYLNKLIRRKHNGMIKIITGLRRSGKSFLLSQLFYSHLIDNGVDNDHILTIDFDNRKNKILRNPDEFLNWIDGKLTDNKIYYVLLDEVQIMDDFVDAMNSLLHIGNVDVYITGSNAKFLSKDVMTEFRGRGDEIHIMPLCFKEFMSAYSGDKQSGLREYMRFGGLPHIMECKTESDKKEYLLNLFANTYLLDIKERYKIRNDADFHELINVMSSNIGGLTNANKIANTFSTVKNSRISNDTVSLYLEYLEDAYLIQRASRYDIKGRKYIGSPQKFYFTDLGLRNARLNFRQEEPTHLMENLIYNELVRRGYSVDVGQVVVNSKNDEGVSTRKTLEVDFVCNMAEKRIYIQSAYRMPDKEKAEQEMASLLRINDSYQKIIIGDELSFNSYNEHGIRFINIYDFLLEKETVE